MAPLSHTEEAAPIDPTDRRAMISAAFAENVRVLQSAEQTTRLANTYLEDLETYMEDLRASLIEHNLEKMRGIIHKTRSGAWWGADQFLDVLRALGDAAKAQDWQLVARYAPEVDREFRLFRSYLGEQIQRQRNNARFYTSQPLNSTYHS